MSDINKVLMIQEELENDIKKLKKQKDELQKSEERYKLISEGSSDGLWDWDLTNDTVHISKEWCEKLGFEEQEIPEYYKKWMKCIHPKDIKKVTSNFHRCLKEKSQFYIYEYRLKLKEGKYIWVCSKGKLLFNDKGEPIRIAGSHTDITEKKMMEKKLERLVYYDQLTGTIIRTAFMDKLKISIEESKKEGLKLSVMFLDVDNFKTVNDMYGHHIGDLFLKKIAARIKSCIRNTDILCRVGGDEFAILLPNLNSINEADEIAQRILDSFNRALIVNRHKLSSSISIGIALYPDNGRNGDCIFLNSGYLRPLSFLHPIIIILLRFCSTPNVDESNSRYSISYPTRFKYLVKLRQASPPLAVNIPGTFSNTNILGLYLLRNRAYSLYSSFLGSAAILSASWALPTNEYA